MFTERKTKCYFRKTKRFTFDYPFISLKRSYNVVLTAL